jgi:hypothetical protein
VSQSTPWRPQPPSISDPEEGEAELEYLGQEDDPPSAFATDDQDEEKKDEPNWIKRAKDAFRFSTTYVDSNYRKQWDDSIRAFNNQHAGDSKYNTELFRKRSNLFRPKTRAIIRKNEAAAAAAFFSNVDLIDVTATNQNDKSELISAEVTKQLIQYRLSKSIPWFQVCIGAVQDGHVQGAVAAHVYWKFYEKHEEGVRVQLEDKPCVDLIPIENLRIDPSADWMNPIESSPYIIHIIPMYWCDVQDRMNYPNPKGQKWKKYGKTSVFGRLNDSTDDSTRQARIQVQQDPSQQKREISDYDIVWIHRHIHKWDGQDWEFYTLASERMLTDPEPLNKTVWHGVRPYVLGKVMLETHKPLSTPVPILVKPLQDEANDLQNQRMDNVKLVLNKRWFAKRGKNVDLASLVRNVPGGITLLDDPELDVKEITWPDVTQSSYLEQDRVDGDFTDLVGNFNPMQVQAQRSGRESTNTMRMLQGPTNLLTEYMLKTFTETFVQPTLRLLMLLEQHYESDITLIALAGQKAQVMKRYGVSDVTDAILDNELNITVNVGMGATDPTMKMQRFLQWVMAFTQICKIPPAGIDLKEIWKEGAGLAGYQDGTRFVLDGSDPEKIKMQQQIQKLTQLLQKSPMAKAEQAHETNVVKERIADKTNVVKLALADKKHVSDARKMIGQHILETEKGDTERQGQVEDRNFTADREDQRTTQEQQAKIAGPKEAPQKLERDPAVDQLKEVVMAMVKGEEHLATAISTLAQSIHDEHEKKKEPEKPRKRKGRARLPSGGEMEFEMEES